MAQLKDLLVAGASRFIGDAYANKLQLTSLSAPTASNSATYGVGTNGNYLRSNGTSLYWDALDAADIPSLSTDKLTSGTLPVARGGTGAASFTANSVIMSGSSTTAAFTTRAITNNTAATAVTASTNLITANTLYYHKGNSNIVTVGTITSGTWNGTTIAVANGGTGATSFTANSIIMSGSSTTAALTTRTVTNNGSAAAIVAGTNIPTMNTIYYGLPNINNSHAYTSGTNIYAPTVGGTATYVLVASGATATPAWYGGTTMAGTAVGSWITTFQGTNDSTTTATGAVQVKGGVGVAKTLYATTLATPKYGTAAPSTAGTAAGALYFQIVS